MAKAIANRFPFAAIVTRPEITKTVGNYFNTYGGNPVSCRAAIAVLDVIEKEHLQENAYKVGLYFLNKLKELEKKYEMIGDVRGRGLFLGIEIVKDRKTREPGTKEAEEMKHK